MGNETVSGTLRAQSKSMHHPARVMHDEFAPSASVGEERSLRRNRTRYARRVLIIGILLAGMIAGAIAQLLLGRASSRIDWTMALVAGLTGSFVGGLLFSLIAGDGLDLRPSGIIGSILGAVIVTGIWIRVDKTKAEEARITRRR